MAPLPSAWATRQEVRCPNAGTNPRVKGPFEGYWDGSGVQQGRVVDLSVSGCFIESMMLPAEGQVVMVSIAIGAGRINLPG